MKDNMIQPQELRIGNLLQTEDGNIHTVVETRENYARTAYNRVDTGKPHQSLTPIEHLYAVPLTEEWLVKFGFVKHELFGFTIDTKETNYKKPFLSIRVITKSGNPFNKEQQEDITPFGRFSDITDVHYVHQLQNLYYALAGEELTLNPKQK